MSALQHPGAAGGPGSNPAKDAADAVAAAQQQMMEAAAAHVSGLVEASNLEHANAMKRRSPSPKRKSDDSEEASIKDEKRVRMESPPTETVTPASEAS
jgi:hypothetical protein